MHKEYKLIVNEEKRTVMIIDKEGNKGKAVAHVDDEWDLMVGIKVAMERVAMSKVNKLKENMVEKLKEVFSMGNRYEAEYIHKLAGFPIIKEEERKPRTLADISEDKYIKMLRNWTYSIGIDDFVFYLTDKYYKVSDLKLRVSITSLKEGIDFEVIENALFDSDGLVLKEGDKVKLTYKKSNENLGKREIRKDKKALFTMGIRSDHNSKTNPFPANDWIVRKVK